VGSELPRDPLLLENPDFITIRARIASVLAAVGRQS